MVPLQDGIRVLELLTLPCNELFTWKEDAGSGI